MRKIFWYSLPFIVIFIMLVLFARFGYDMDLRTALLAVASIFGIGGGIVALVCFCNRMANK